MSRCPTTWGRCDEWLLQSGSTAGSDRQTWISSCRDKNWRHLKSNISHFNTTETYHRSPYISVPFSMFHTRKLLHNRGDEQETVIEYNRLVLLLLLLNLLFNKSKYYTNIQLSLVYFYSSNTQPVISRHWENSFRSCSQTGEKFSS